MRCLPPPLNSFNRPLTYKYIQNVFDNSYKKTYFTIFGLVRGVYKAKMQSLHFLTKNDTNVIRSPLKNKFGVHFYVQAVTVPSGQWTLVIIVSYYIWYIRFTKFTSYVRPDTMKVKKCFLSKQSERDVKNPFALFNDVNECH